MNPNVRAGVRLESVDIYHRLFAAKKEGNRSDHAISIRGRLRVRGCCYADPKVNVNELKPDPSSIRT
jgi:hypothetical protein